MQLPETFIQTTCEIFGEERFRRFAAALDEPATVSIRMNPLKSGEWREESGEWKVESGERIPWCRDGFYLKERPDFTFDPLLHAGCYYVQEASSMFLGEVLRQYVSSGEDSFEPRTALDLCAAPGGKSTLLRAALPKECVLYSNEPVRKRASILLENVTKWGYENHVVSNVYPREYRKSGMRFDLILCDVPCSGEGMFRKDPDAVKEWSPENVEKCWRLQREIVSDAWECLNEGGLLIYSTCTYNTKENEENIRWMVEELGAEVLPVETQPGWGITGSLLEGFSLPVYRFIPGFTKGEGLFMAVLRRTTPNDMPRKPKAIPLMKCDEAQAPVAQADLSYRDAIAYLRGEALILPSETPKGIVQVNYKHHSLGLVKNIGTRANNLYPKEWRIKSTYVPDEYQPVLLT